MDDLFEQSLIEDLDSFLDDVAEEDLYASSQELGLYDRFPKERRTTGRRIKQLWSKHADHAFFKHATYGHTANYDKIASLVSNQQSDAEISAKIGNNIDDVFPPMTDSNQAVAIVKGKVTLASNNMDCIYSGPYLHQNPEGWPTNRKCSGFSKYPGTFTRKDAQSYVLSAEDLVSYERVKTAKRIHDIKGGAGSIGFSEALLDNWQIVGIFLNRPGEKSGPLWYLSDKNIGKRHSEGYLYYLGNILNLIYQCYLNGVPLFAKDYTTMKLIKVVDSGSKLDEKFMMGILYHADEDEVPTEFMEIWKKMKNATNEPQETDLYSEISEALLEAIDDTLDEKKRKKRKKKKKKKGGKKDACYHKVKSRYRVWPSAYASGALVKCRKVGAANWGNKSKKKNESIESDAYLLQVIKEELQAVLDEKKKKRKKKPKKRKKAGTESSKESSLRDWFGRKGAKGKKKGWVDCNAPDGKGGYKSCGRSSGEGRKKYPACRPTPGACKERGKGKSWGKKAAKKKK